ncbi:hypothetical protein SISSUDRAFT_1121451 [Sistotremastrum suecicum HHB10207 ss-3]|uniref:Uncharacterized protein n=1 Tax=Sistotremastrum suecicum HHB10207 ss-3 TaxID=1314776 RepID=A0A166AT15_9AGAM|nr:hypothetical protein SISSUDRAFT_1121451 [Sistotremastrum suecicum HHB10207 ss-3]
MSWTADIGSKWYHAFSRASPLDIITPPLTRDERLRRAGRRHFAVHENHRMTALCIVGEVNVRNEVQDLGSAYGNAHQFAIKTTMIVQSAHQRQRHACLKLMQYAPYIATQTPWISLTVHTKDVDSFHGKSSLPLCLGEYKGRDAAFTLSWKFAREYFQRRNAIFYQFITISTVYMRISRWKVWSKHNNRTEGQGLLSNLSPSASASVPQIHHIGSSYQHHPPPRFIPGECTCEAQCIHFPGCATGSQASAWAHGEATADLGDAVLAHCSDDNCFLVTLSNLAESQAPAVSRALLNPEPQTWAVPYPRKQRATPPSLERRPCLPLPPSPSLRARILSTKNSGSRSHTQDLVARPTSRSTNTLSRVNNFPNRSALDLRLLRDHSGFLEETESAQARVPHPRSARVHLSAHPRLIETHAQGKSISVLSTIPGVSTRFVSVEHASHHQELGSGPSCVNLESTEEFPISPDQEHFVSEMISRYILIPSPPMPGNSLPSHRLPISGRLPSPENSSSFDSDRLPSATTGGGGSSHGIVARGGRGGDIQVGCKNSSTASQMAFGSGPTCVLNIYMSPGDLTTPFARIA